MIRDRLAKSGFRNSVTTVKRGMILSLGILATAASARGTVLFAGGAWAAIDRGAVCEALSRSQNIAPRDKVQAEAGVTFTANGSRQAEVHFRLTRLPRGDASVILHVGDQPFLLVTRSGLAWSRGPMQAQAIMEAFRAGTTMRVESRDMAGVRFSDPYLLDGAPTAIDAAAARCALRGAGKVQ